MNPRSAVFLALCLSPLGCSTAEEAPPVEPRAKPELMRTALPDMPGGHPDLGALSVASRGPRRLSVRQLERSLDVVANAPAGTVKLPEALALALGQPDYLRITEESLEPSPLFMKLMMDVAGFVCTSLSESDPQRPEDQRVLTRYADLEENHRYMLLRFLGLEGARAEVYLPRLRAVYEAASAGARGPAGGAEAVCIALVTSPEFLLY